MVSTWPTGRRVWARPGLVNRYRAGSMNDAKRLPWQLHLLAIMIALVTTITAWYAPQTLLLWMGEEPGNLTWQIVTLLVGPVILCMGFGIGLMVGHATAQRIFKAAKFDAASGASK